MKNKQKNDFLWKFLLGIFSGGNQDAMEEYKQKVAFLQNCSMPLQFSGGLHL